MKKHMKWLVSVMTVFYLAMNLCAMATSATEGTGMYVYGEYAEIVDNVLSITVSAKNYGGTGFNGISLDLRYDNTAFAYSTVEIDSQFDGASTMMNYYGDIGFIWESATPCTGESIRLFTVRFIIADNIEEGNHDFYLTCNELYKCEVTNNETTFSDINTASDDISVWIGEKLELTPSEINFSVGQNTKIFANKDVDYWDSLDETVATVDQDGNVTAVAVGVTQIIAHGGVNNEELALIKVFVNPKRVLMLSINNIPDKTLYYVGETLDLAGLRLKVLYDNGDSAIIDTGFDAEYDFTVAGTKTVRIKYEGLYAGYEVVVNPLYITSPVYLANSKYISDIPAETGIADFLTNIDNNQCIRVLDENGSQNIDGIIKTGMTVCYVEDNEIMHSITIVVDGDVNCDGKFNVIDLIRLKKAIVSSSSLSEAQCFAAAGEAKAELSAVEIVRIRKALLLIM